MAYTAPNFQLFSSLRYDRRLLESNANTALNHGTPSPFYMLSHHRDRMLQAAEKFNFDTAIEKIQGTQALATLQRTIESNIDMSSTSPLRVKILLSHDGIFTVESNITPPVPLENLFPSSLPYPEGQDPALKMKVSALTGGALSLGASKLPGSPEQEIQWTVIPDTALTPATAYTTYKTTSRNMYDTARSRVGIASMTDTKEVVIISEDEAIMEGSLTTAYFWRGGKWVTPPVESGGQIGTTRRWALNKGICDEEKVSRGSLVDGEECWISNGVRGFIWGKVQLK